MPIPLERLEAHLHEVGETLGNAMPPGVGFALIFFDFGQGNHISYVSNGQRADMIAALRELLAKIAGQPTSEEPR